MNVRMSMVVLLVMLLMFYGVGFYLFMSSSLPNQEKPLKEEGEGDEVRRLKGLNENLEKEKSKLLEEIGQLKILLNEKGKVTNGSDGEDRELEESKGGENKEPEIALLVITYVRADALNKSMSTVLKRIKGYPIDIIISQDGEDKGVADIVNSIKSKVHSVEVTHIQHKERTAPQIKSGEMVGYYYIAQHYKFALDYVFSKSYNYVIILEEDIEISVDFFDYFLKLKEILDQDDTVFCISAWNDNGRPGLVDDHHLLYRTDFFPGLGWMMKRSFWEEIKDRWPAGYWDDWLRETPQRKGRACIYPEISRTYTFGLFDGTSQGQFAKEFLQTIILNEEEVDWKSKDVSYLLKEKYDEHFKKLLKGAKIVDVNDVDNHKKQDLIVEYDKGKHEYLCHHFGLMQDEKVGVLRTSYQDVIPFKRESNRIFLTPRGFQSSLT